MRPLWCFLISTSLLDDDCCGGVEAKCTLGRAGREMESDIVVLTSSICARASSRRGGKGKKKSSFLRGYKKVFHLSSLFFFLCFSTIVLGNEAGEYDKATEVTSTNLIKEEGDLIHLWESVRFSHLSPTFISQVVTSSPFWPAIARTQSYATSQMHPEERRR